MFKMLSQRSCCLSLRPQDQLAPSGCGRGASWLLRPLGPKRKLRQGERGSHVNAVAPILPGPFGEKDFFLFYFFGGGRGI